MGRQFLLFLLLTALRQLLQAPLEIGIPAGIALHAEPGCFLHQQLGLPGTHMEDAVAAVIGLLLVLVGKKNRINHLGGIRAETCCPAAVVVAVLLHLKDHLMHQTIKKVGADIEGLKMNTAIAQLMTLVNTLYDNGGATKAEYETVVQLLNPFAPHMTEELWEKLGHSHDEQLAYYPWPQYEEAKCVEAMVEIAVQVNGKVKARLKVAADITSEDAIAAAKAEPAVAEALAGKTIAKEIYVKGRLVNLAVKG